jgi:hypothetical protein
MATCSVSGPSCSCRLRCHPLDHSSRRRRRLGTMVLSSNSVSARKGRAERPTSRLRTAGVMAPHVASLPQDGDHGRGRVPDGCCGARIGWCRPCDAFPSGRRVGLGCWSWSFGGSSRRCPRATGHLPAALGVRGRTAAADIDAPASGSPGRSLRVSRSCQGPDHRPGKEPSKRHSKGALGNALGNPLENPLETTLKKGAL